jgi:hypothetical protein
MRKLMKYALLLALFVPAAASAQLTLGARVGYAFPTGQIEDEPDSDLKDSFAYQIPLQVEAGWRFSPDLSLGAYFSAGYAAPGDDLEAELCDLDGVDCSLRVLRLGLQLGYTFSQVSPSFVPWVGIGTGWEWANVEADTDGPDASIRANGWEVVNLQAGADFKVSPQFAIGPFVQYSTGRYGETEIEEGGTTLTQDIDNKAFHGWLQLGLRGRFDL